MSESTS